MSEQDDTCRYHRPLRDGRIQVGDFKQIAYLIEAPDGRRAKGSQLEVRVTWPRFFDEIRTSNTREFVLKKLGELAEFWNTESRGKLLNLWLESEPESAHARSVAIPKVSTIDLEPRAVRWLRDKDTDTVRFAPKDNHPVKVPAGEKGTVRDFVIRMWAAPVTLTFRLPIVDVDLTKGDWRLGMLFPGKAPALYRFDETVKPPKLGERMTTRIDRSVFDAELGGAYYAEIR